MSVFSDRRRSFLISRTPFSLAAVVALFSLAIGASARADSFPLGSAKHTVSVGNTQLDIFTYKPKNYKNGPLLLIFHGVARNADTYRDSAITLGDQHGALIVAPLFDEKRFPSRLYQRG